MELESILYEFPFLQSARAIHLKGLYNQDSFRYNMELKKTAAHTNDRSVLFDFITSENFQSIQKDYLQEKEKAIEEITVKETETVTPKPEQPAISPADRLERSIKQTIEEAEESHKEKEQFKEAEETPVIVTSPLFTPSEKEVPFTEPVRNETEEKLEIGKPFEFDNSEKHSFQEWLQLSKLTPIKREETQEAENESEIEPSENKTEIEKEEIKEETTDNNDDSLSKKLELIDKFIESSPKIIPTKGIAPPPANIERSSRDSSLLMTETLARVYLEQKKYQKAIQAYEILILKYPEKSVFFADRISDIKILQQNNNTNNNV